MFRAALRSALAMKLKDNQLNVVDAFSLDDHKTKAFAQALTGLGLSRKILVVDHQENPNLQLAARNLSDVNLIASLQVTPYQVLNATPCRFFEGCNSGYRGGAEEMSTSYDIIRRPVITEKGLTLKEDDQTLCFEVSNRASKTQIQGSHRAHFQSESRARSHHERSRQRAPPRQVTRATGRTGRRRMSRFAKAKK